MLHERYQNLPEEQKNKKENMATDNIRIFQIMKKKIIIEYRKIYSEIKKNKILL